MCSYGTAELKQYEKNQTSPLVCLLYDVFNHDWKNAISLLTISFSLIQCFPSSVNTGISFYIKSVVTFEPL